MRPVLRSTLLGSLLTVSLLATLPACGPRGTLAFSLPDLQGRPVTVDARSQHRPKLILFWASW